MRHDHVNITMLAWIILTANMGMDETSTQAVFSTPNLLLFHCKNGLVPLNITSRTLLKYCSFVPEVYI